ncbi:AAA family ATPase [Clostridium estertheticum]|uniref:AAA family ATPase n=1 Tax=Clostridium estertheticum TaxID=238834 RepID=UPI0013EE7C10|nr:AAA family ATPase [Clostridium estertheticum]MBZ9608703.1 AAA family ATPase [Clostridium estertheticum]
MKITQLDIRDFGVFQGEKLEELGSGIIVIGGANRSGKTTLMQVLRNIPFGFSKNSGIPPAKFQYDVRCDLLLDDGNGVNVLLKGFSNPEIVYNNATDNKANKELYNIDKSAYRELFTISLNELNKSSGKEDSNLQSMLLGAGFKHIAKIPGVAKELREKANTIGGTRGNPSTKMFKPFTENIKKGVEGRKKSISMLDTFAEKKNILSHLQATIISKEKQLEISNNNIIKLDILRHNYELNQDRKNIEGELQTYFFSHSDIKEYNIEKAKTLKTQYIKELEQYNNEFQREIITEKPMKELLLGSKDLISDFYNGISGIKEMNKNLLSEKNEYYEKTQLLMNKIKKSNDNWSSFKDISEINCDEVEQCILIQNIEKFKKAEYDRALCDKRSGDLKIQREILEKQIVTCDSATYMKKYFYLTISFMILGLALFFIDKLLGCSLIIIGAIGSALYLFINYSNSKLIINRNIEIKTQIDNRSGDISNNSQEIISLDEDLRELNNIMDEYRDILKLDGRVSVEGIKDYFKTVSYLKDEISEYYLLKKKLSSHFNTLNESLSSIDEVLKKFTEFNTKNPEEINLENIENICSDILLKLEELYKYLILVEKAHESYLKLNMVEHEILGLLGSNYLEDIILNIEKYISQGEKYIKYLNMQNELKIIQEKLLQSVKSQRIKKILYDGKIEAAPSDDANLLKILENLYSEYINIDELTYEYEGLNAEIKELIGQLDILKNEKQTLKDELLALNSDEMLVQYDKEIRQSRGHLRPLAEKYAVYNTAALLLEKIREKFLESTKDKLLEGASDILSEITSGEYIDIVPMEDLMQGDFKTVLRDESVKESSRELSRGTKEQLFLAVRISRIKEIKPSLPVILDDSFVNFDIAHTKNTVKALVQLSKTHQIFVLTCHATLVELINDLEKQAQYFKLDKGKFEKSTGGDLKKYLKEL